MCQQLSASVQVPSAIHDNVLANRNNIANSFNDVRHLSTCESNEIIMDVIEILSQTSAQERRVKHSEKKRSTHLNVIRLSAELLMSGARR